MAGRKGSTLETPHAHHQEQEEGRNSRREEELLTVREVARRLRVDDTTVRRWVKTGAIAAITLPHRGKRQAYRIRQSTLDTILASPPPAP